MHAVVHAVIHRGAVRPGNEDALAVGDWIAGNDVERPKRFEHDLTQGPLPVVVADGMGGHAAGDVASRCATETVRDAAPEVRTVEQAADLLARANRAVYDMMDSGEGAPGMGTTIAAVILRADSCMQLNVGDSRIYRMDPTGGLEQLSVDDTPGPKLDNGRTAAQTTPVVSQSLGGQPGFTPVEPHAEADTPVAESRYLLCSDGLSDLVEAGEISEILKRADGDEGDFRAVDRLFQAAMDRGGKDNITIALVRLTD
jgi:serine/threonine protein phosphatase PrpC